MIEKLTTIQTKSNSTLVKLSDFMNNTFLVQDKVVTSLKDGQEALNDKMDKISTQVQSQMRSMAGLLADFKTTMIGMVWGKYDT